MKKILKWTGIVLVSLLAIGGLSLWWMMRHPSPDEVCAHMATLLPPGAENSSRLVAQCQRQTQPPRYGKLPYARRMRCMAEASTLEAFQICAER